MDSQWHKSLTGCSFIPPTIGLGLERGMGHSQLLWNTTHHGLQLHQGALVARCLD